MIPVEQNYTKHAQTSKNALERQHQRTYQQKAFNNWIKSVLINIYTKELSETLERVLDTRKGSNDKLLHVLDIGCGRGQDIKKWALSRVKYMVASDFSEECVKVYEERWRQKEPYQLHTVVADFTTTKMYNQIEHSFYDIVSAQFCFHYMFKSEKNIVEGLHSILSNLLIGGVFIATIPDSYSILRKIKEKGKKEGDSTVYGNKYFSMKFTTTNFTEPFGNQYGFYLEDAVGSKDEDGNIQYTNEWLISLDHLEKLLQVQGVKIQETLNFLEFYLKYREEYKDLFHKFKLTYNMGQQMDPELWEICHLYRVLICRKIDKGKQMNAYSIKERIQARKGKHIQRRAQNHYDNSRNRPRNHRGHSHDHYSKKFSESNNRRFQR